MKRLLILLLIFSLLLTPGCSTQLPGSTTEPQPVQTTPVPTPTPSSTPDAASAPDMQPEMDYTYPLKEADVQAIFEAEYADQPVEVKKITRYVNDFLVELSDEYSPDFSILFWIFGETGRIVQLSGFHNFTSYEIRGTGSIVFTHSGAHSETPFKGLPVSGRSHVLCDAYGMLDERYTDFEFVENTEWLETTEPVYVGYWSDADNAPADSDRKYQLYDARIDADGLSFSFIPGGNDHWEFQSFFIAATYCPSIDVSMDGNMLTLRFYNTSLECDVSDEDAKEWLGHTDIYPEYPYSFPEGSLGRDNHFLADVEIHQDGSDAVVTCRLTENAGHYTVERSDLGGDTIPLLRIIFRH